MSLIDRLLGRAPTPSAPMGPPAPEPPLDEDLERWVAAAERVSASLGAGGRLAVAVLGESLVGERASWWFGYEPSREGLAELFVALGEDPAAAGELIAIEAGMVGRRPGRLSSATRTRWREVVDAALRDRGAAAVVPERDDVHREAEQVWRDAAGSVQSWRAVQLDPDRALRQVRWYPGCSTRTFIGYSDPLGLGTVQRAVEEHRYSAEEWQALQSAEEMSRRVVDPLAWRLSSLSYAVRAGLDD